jgi:glycolate oxidase
VRALRGLVRADNVIDDDVRLAAYETDALTAYRQRPLAVALPSPRRKSPRSCVTPRARA